MKASNAVAAPAATTRERILASARTLLGQSGFEALSTRNVAARAGCSIGTIYTHFRDFDDVVLHLNAETVRWLGQALRQAAGAPSAARPAALVDAYFDFLEAHETSWSALFQHVPSAPCELPEWYREVIDGVVSDVVNWLDDLAAGVPAAERRRLIVALWCGLHGIASLERQSKLATVVPDASPRRLAHSLVRSALIGAGWDGR